MDTDIDLYVFGNKSGPRAPRAVADFLLDSEDFTVPAGVLPLPLGASAFSEPLVNPVPTGPYHLLPLGSRLPEGLAVVRDDPVACAQSDRPASHHTFYALRPMPFLEFREKFLGLPWQYAGRKD